MDFYLQNGAGMMAHTRTLLDDWDSTGAILSPRDLNPDQLVRLASAIHDRDGTVLLDPQFYLPDADHHRLQEHDYWPDEYDSATFWGDDGNYARLITELHDLNTQLDADIIILPALHGEGQQLTEDWYARQEEIHSLGGQLYDDEADLFATVSLSPDILQDPDEIRSLQFESEDWDIDGIYLVGEHPPDQYLLNSPTWLSNLMDLVAGWRLEGKAVIIGYANQQMLITACASPSALASGNWRNVRSFPPDKFYTRDEIRRHSTWYYVPQALSEYQLEYLDIAQNQGVLEQMRPPEDLENQYTNKLFAGPQPSTVGFSNSPDAFRHYLRSLRAQTIEMRRGSYPDTLDQVESLVDTAFTLTERWSDQGVFGSYREFGEDEHNASIAALRVLDSNRGPTLRRKWDDLG